MPARRTASCFRLLRDTGFDVVDLVELYAPDDAVDHPYYDAFSAEWARKWPARRSGSRRSPDDGSSSPRRRRSGARSSSSSGSRSTSSRPTYVEHDPPDADPVELVRGHAEGKARSVHAEGAVTLGVDTTVILDGRVYGKPADRDDARRDARTSSAGRTHSSSPASASSAPGFDVVEHEVTDVTFRALAGAEIDAYVESGEWAGRAGAYAIQGLGGRLVERIEGDYLNVVGLPGALLVDDSSTVDAPNLLQIRS